jgi:hypothetical protein
MKWLAYKFVTWALSYASEAPNQSAELDKITASSTPAVQ